MTITDADIEFAQTTCAKCQASGPLQFDDKSQEWLCYGCYEWPPSSPPVSGEDLGF